MNHTQMNAPNRVPAADGDFTWSLTPWAQQRPGSGTRDIVFVNGAATPAEVHKKVAFIAIVQRNSERVSTMRRRRIGYTQYHRWILIKQIGPGSRPVGRVRSNVRVFDYQMKVVRVIYGLLH